LTSALIVHSFSGQTVFRLQAFNYGEMINVDARLSHNMITLYTKVDVLRLASAKRRDCHGEGGRHFSAKLSLNVRQLLAAPSANAQRPTQTTHSGTWWYSGRGLK